MSTLPKKSPRWSEPSAFYWPGMLDLVTSTLMVFVLVGFLQTTLNLKDIEVLLTRNKQDLFLDLFNQAFARELEDSTIAVQRHLDFLQITFSDRVLFKSSQYVLQPAGRRLLERCARILREASVSGYQQIQVEGHTDNRPLVRSIYPRDNWELSTARALSVVRHLTLQGLPPAVFSANGYANHRPVASNADSSGRGRNRRIEIRLFFSVGTPAASGAGRASK